MRGLAQTHDMSRVNPAAWRRMLQLVWTHPAAQGLDQVNEYLEDSENHRPRPEVVRPTRPESLIWS